MLLHSLKYSSNKLLIAPIAVVLLYSCNSLKKSQENVRIFEILTRVSYPEKQISDNHTGYKTLGDFLDTEALEVFSGWKNNHQNLHNLYDIDCLGCKNDIKQFSPIYKFNNGNFIHFGFKEDMGITNYVFKTNGAYVTNFFTYQGYSKTNMTKELQKRGESKYIIAGIYPKSITKDNIYLEHVEYSEQNNNENWYNTLFPQKISYRYNLKSKTPKMQFQFNGGFYSYQYHDKNDDYTMVHFLELPCFKSTQDHPSLPSQSCIAKAYYGHATLFLLTLAEIKTLSLNIVSNVPNKEFQFSILKNNRFYTIDELLNKKSKLHSSHITTLKPGSYLIRVFTNSVSAENALFNLNIAIAH